MTRELCEESYTIVSHFPISLTMTVGVMHVTVYTSVHKLQSVTLEVTCLPLRDTEVARRLFVTEDKKLPQIAVLPFGREEDIFSLEAESTDLSRETDNLLGILESFAKDTPRTGDPEDSHSPPLVTVMDTVFFYGIVKEKKTDDVLASFCLKGIHICYN